MGDGPNPKAKWSKYKVVDPASFWPFTTTGNPAADAATRPRLNELFVFT